VGHFPGQTLTRWCGASLTLFLVEDLRQSEDCSGLDYDSIDNDMVNIVVGTLLD
jgi:hypothetical protein